MSFDPFRTSLAILLAAAIAVVVSPASADPARPGSATTSAATATPPLANGLRTGAGAAASAAAVGTLPAAGAATAPLAPYPDDADAYRLGIGDVVEVSVWKSPELGIAAPVRPDGRISVPLLGDIPAEGMTTNELKQILATRFRDYVTAPAVSVIVKEIHSQKVFVTGEVAKPGSYDLQPRTKLLQAIAMAGGTTPYAKGRAVVLRDRGKSDRRYEINLRDVIGGTAPQDNLLLQSGDTIVVP